MLLSVHGSPGEVSFKASNGCGNTVYVPSSQIEKPVK
jgi:hypothetical protein